MRPTRRRPMPLLLVAAAVLAGTCTPTPRARTAGAAEDPPKVFRVTPAGTLVTDSTTRQPAVGALPVDLARSPDRSGPGGRGRYLVVVNSGFGLQFNAASNRAQQSLAVIDLAATPDPAVIQNVYFPTPHSVNVGLAFAPQPEADGSYALYASGGFENVVWVFRFRPGAPEPISPAAFAAGGAPGVPSFDVSAFASEPASPLYNANRAPAYPTGLAIAADGNTLFVANNLGDSLGVVSDLRGGRALTRVDLRRPGGGAVYPYGVAAVPGKAYVSLWNDASVAVVDPAAPRVTSRISVARHPTAMALNARRTRLYVVNSNADSVSVIDTAADREVERIDVRLAEGELVGSSPEGLALSEDERTLYVANAHSNSVAVVALSPAARGEEGTTAGRQPERSTVRGFIPTGQYPSAVAVVGRTIFVGNGKGTGFESSSVVANESGRSPNVPNDRFPGRAESGGQYVVSLVSGNVSAVEEPGERALAAYTQQVMRNNGLLGARRARLFEGRSPIRHVVYVIKENRTYDQVFGDLARAGDGRPADGDPSLAIFGAGEAARRPGGPPQNVTPNHRALALRFGLLDRFFVNSEASPDGHNWSTAAFSSDYVDKAFRWNYSGRGRTYDFEGFNRLPNFGGNERQAPLVRLPATAEDVADFTRRYIPYLQGGRDVAEPETLYLWDAAARAGLTYRNYGEFVGTQSEADIAELNSRRPKAYPDTSPVVVAVPTKKALEGRVSETFPNYDLLTPDAMTVESYRAAKAAGAAADPLVSRANADARFRGTSRLGEWLREFAGFVADLEAGRPDRMPNFSIVRLSNDHTAGLQPGLPTPQFYMADNDYALGRLVEAISNSPYWKDTAIFVVEDDAQDGPDHVDAHRSVAMVISAYNKPGGLVHEFHNTVSLIRTMELLLGMEPMNRLDASAVPIDIFRDTPDFTPYKALLPEIAGDNLLTPAARDAQTAHWMLRTAEQDLEHADMANPRILNQIIWFSVRGPASPMPEVARLPAFDAMRAGILEEDEEGEEHEHVD